MTFSLFNRSFPFVELIESELKALQEAAAILDTLFLDFQELTSKCMRIRSLAAESETAADEVTRQLALTFLKPEERKDIYELNLALQDSMLAVKNVSTRVGLYGCQIQKGAQSLTRILLEMLAECSRLIDNLKIARPVDENRRKMRRLKEEAQMFLLVCLGETYESEPKTPSEVLEVVKWGQIYDRLEETLISTSRLVSIVEGMILKNV